MFSDVLVVLATLLALFLPGIAIGLSLGLRWSSAVGAAPALSFGIVATAGSLATFAAFRWTPWTFVAGTLAACGLVLAVRWAPRRRRPGRSGPLVHHPRRPTPGDLLIAGGVLVGWAVSAAVLARGFGGFDQPNQDWDYVFHANALRLIADTDDVAPRALRAINDWEVQSSFYPNAFHALGAVVRDLTGAQVFVGLNAMALMIPGVAGLGLALLLRSLTAPTVVSAATPVLLAGFASFPYDVLSRGPLLPFSMGIALIPAFFLVLGAALDRRSAAAVGAGLAAAALLGVQTSAALSAALVAVPMLAQRWVRRDRRLPAELIPLGIAGVTAVAFGSAYVAGALAMNSGGPRVDWPAVQSMGQAVGDLLLLNHAAAHPQLWLAGLVLVGLFGLRSAPYLWAWVAGGGIAFVLFVLAASSDSQWVEDVTAPWWNDRFRFAALAVLALAPLAAHGLHLLACVVARSRLLPWLLPRHRVVVAATAGLVAVGLLSDGLYVRTNQDEIAFTYQTLEQLDETEIAAMRWLAEQPGAADVQVMNDPNDGSPYMSALFGLRPVFGHIMPAGEAPGRVQRLLLDHFNCLDTTEELRAAVQDLDIGYVYLSDGYVRENWSRMRGLLGMGRVDSVERVYDEGGVEIYRVELTPEPAEGRSDCTLDEG